MESMKKDAACRQYWLFHPFIHLLSARKSWEAKIENQLAVGRAYPIS
jgi:hypothetical protein